MDNENRIPHEQPMDKTDVTGTANRVQSDYQTQGYPQQGQMDGMTGQMPDPNRYYRNIGQPEAMPYMYQPVMPGVTNEALLYEVRGNAGQLAALQKQTALIRDVTDQLLETHMRQDDNLRNQLNKSKVAEELLRSENSTLQAENDTLRTEKQRLQRQIFEMEGTATKLKEKYDMFAGRFWKDDDWNLGQMTLPMLKQLHLPIVKPPHLQKDKFPFTCEKCGRTLWDVEEICDDLYPLIPYDGKTVYCQGCFNTHIFPLRIKNAEEAYTLGKSFSMKRSAKMRRASNARKAAEEAAADTTTESK